MLMMIMIIIIFVIIIFIIIIISIIIIVIIIIIIIIKILIPTFSKKRSNCATTNKIYRQFNFLFPPPHTMVA